jgi:phosphatidylglycerophosphate synthase
LLDIVADNVLRSIVWISATIEARKGGDVSAGPIIWTAVIFLEWITMFCSQSNVSERCQENHWKDMERRHPPFWVEAVFRNNFKTIPGISAICGLFIAPLASYVFYAEETWAKKFLSLNGTFYLLLLSYAARTLSAFVELWICLDYTCDILKQGRVYNGRKTKVY